MLNLENKNIIIATHVYATGPAQDLREYLLSKKVEKLLFIGHPLFWDEKLSGSGYEVYEKGELKEEKYRKIKKNFALLLYSIDIWLNIFWVWKKMPKSELYVGCDNINAFSGIVLRFFGKTKKVVYYVIDYNPTRFDIKILNYFYHKLDQFCVRYADETWNLSPRMAEARKAYFGFSAGVQITVPIGIWFSRFPRLNFSQIQKHTLVFMGHLLEKQGVQYVLEAIPAIAQKMPDFKFLIIGDGKYLKNLKEQIGKLGVGKNITFTGYIEKHIEMEKMLSECSCAVAMYDKYEKNGSLSFTYFADPGKIKAYLAGGLPILLSDVSHNAREIEKKRCGFVISQDKNEIAQKVIALLEDEKTLQEYRDNAIDYAKQFDWEKVFKNNLNRLI